MEKKLDKAWLPRPSVHVAQEHRICLYSVSTLLPPPTFGACFSQQTVPFPPSTGSCHLECTHSTFPLSANFRFIWGYQTGIRLLVVFSDKQLNLSDSQFPHLLNKDNKIIVVVQLQSCICKVVQLQSCDHKRVHGIFLGKNTEVDCHFLLQGIFPTQGSNPSFLSISCIAGGYFFFFFFNH